MEDGKQMQYALGGAAAVLMGVAGLYMSSRQSGEATKKDGGAGNAS